MRRWTWRRGRPDAVAGRCPVGVGARRLVGRRRASAEAEGGPDQGKGVPRRVFWGVCARMVARPHAGRLPAFAFHLASPHLSLHAFASLPRDRPLLTRLSSLLHSLHVALTMYSTLVSVALFSALAIQGALAEFTVSTPAEISTVSLSLPLRALHTRSSTLTPAILQCGSVKLSWEKVEGIKNFNVAIVSTENPCEDIM